MLERRRIELDIEIPAGQVTWLLSDLVAAVKARGGRIGHEDRIPCRLVEREPASVTDIETRRRGGNSRSNRS